MIYVYFYAFVSLSAVTGILLQQKIFPAWKGPIEAAHKWGLYWFPLFIVWHFIALVIAERTHRRGLASKMIAGE